jgi:phosphotransferase system  glucose/maltose/N-acetylglucosamine-specific IIC component
VVPAILLIALGVGGRGTTAPRRAVIGALAVVILGIGAWIVPFALSETSCWIARSGLGGTIVYSQVSASDTSTLGPGDLASGCDGGSFTLQGVGLAAVLGIGAAAMAVLAATDSPRTRRASG